MKLDKELLSQIIKSKPRITHSKYSPKHKFSGGYSVHFLGITYFAGTTRKQAERTARQVKREAREGNWWYLPRQK